jgi:hypothetical protein
VRISEEQESGTGVASPVSRIEDRNGIARPIDERLLSWLVVVARLAVQSGIYVDPKGEDLVIYTVYSNDLTDEQDAGVDKVEFRDGNSLSHKQIGKILGMGRSTDTTDLLSVISTSDN